MCELMAMSFGEPISADFSLAPFGLRGEDNPDGWGLAWYPDGGRSVAIVKEPVKWATSSTASFLSNSPALLSRIYLAHVRYKTVGNVPVHADTHPFGREWAGIDYAFAHNGTLENPAENFALGDYRPVGATDSEHFFCHLMAEIARRSGPIAALADFRWLHAKLAHANRFGKLNALISDGTRLFVYHDVNGWKGLNFRAVEIYPDRDRHFGDDEIEVDIGSPPNRSANRGWVVASKVLSQNHWRPFQLGEMLVFEGGRIVFSSHREISATKSLVASC